MISSPLAFRRRNILFLCFIFIVVYFFLPRTAYISHNRDVFPVDSKPPPQVEGVDYDNVKGSQTVKLEGGEGETKELQESPESHEAHDEPEWKLDQDIPTESSEESKGHEKSQDHEEPILPTSPSLVAKLQDTQHRIWQLIRSWTPGGPENHWPPYDDYADKDYDPNRWESFEWDNDFYINNGISKIKQERPDTVAVPYHPYPSYNSKEWQAKWKGEFTACEGPRGKLLNESSDDIVKAYPALPSGFPAVSIGDAHATGIDTSVCFDRYNRYGPYGYGQEEHGSIEDWTLPAVSPNWNNTRWGKLQDECLKANEARFEMTARQPSETKPTYKLPLSASEMPENQSKSSPSFHHRTAILMRTWEGYNYTENDLQALRALITESSLLSGGEYQVFMFLNVKNKTLDFFNNTEVHQTILDENIPKEFHDITVLWNEVVLEQWYPLVGDWQVYWSQFMPLQWFAKTHPEFDYVWNWETDARYTGNHYSFFESVAQFAQQYPRKYMWERNQRHFFPDVHGSYQDWLKDTDHTIEQGIQDKTVDPVWGPRPYNATRQSPIGPTPPKTMSEDNFEWGVGEEADLITLLPIWDPTHTEWSFRKKIWNFVPGVRPHFTADDGVDEHYDHPDFVNIPRRTYINTVSRFSKKLLHAMHLENSAGRNMQAEMWPATVTLHHGLKAVYVPHPIWSDRKWPGWYADAIFNADGGAAGQWNQRNNSAYAHDREHNYGGWSWYYDGSFAKHIYRRWLGWATWDESPLSGVGGSSFEDEGVVVDLPPSGIPPSEAGTPPEEEPQTTPTRIGGRGRMCLPPMLLHPVKKVFEEADAMPERKAEPEAKSDVDAGPGADAEPESSTGSDSDSDYKAESDSESKSEVV